MNRWLHRLIKNATNAAVNLTSSTNLQMTRAVTGEELESDRLKARLGAALIERDLLNEKIALLESDRPFVRRRRKS